MSIRVGPGGEDRSAQSDERSAKLDERAGRPDECAGRLGERAGRLDDSLAEYVRRAARLAPLLRARPLPDALRGYAPPALRGYAPAPDLASELERSVLYEPADSIDIKALKSLSSQSQDSLWNGKPQQYFESMNYGELARSDDDAKDYDSDSLAP